MAYPFRTFLNLRKLLSDIFNTTDGHDHDGVNSKKVTAPGELLLADGKILVGNASGDADPVALSGDITITRLGVSTIGAKKIKDTMIIAEAGTVLVGTKTDGDVTKLDASAEGALVIGQGSGETVAAAVMSSEATMDKTGAVTLGIKPIIASGGDTMSVEENVAGLSSAITLANEIRGDFINHAANATRHTTGVQDTSGIEAEATDLATLITLTTSVMALYVAHNADAALASEWAYHNEQATTKALASEVAPTTLAECITKLNDVKAKYNDHEDETTGHASEASVTADQVAASNAANGVTNRVPIVGVTTGDLVSWAILNDGTGNVTGVSATAGVGYVDFTFSADPQGDAIISYIVMRPLAA